MPSCPLWFFCSASWRGYGSRTGKCSIPLHRRGNQMRPAAFSGAAQSLRGPWNFLAPAHSALPPHWCSHGGFVVSAKESTGSHCRPRPAARSPAHLVGWDRGRWDAQPTSHIPAALRLGQRGEGKGRLLVHICAPPAVCPRASYFPSLTLCHHLRGLNGLPLEYLSHRTSVNLRHIY